MAKSPLASQVLKSPGSMLDGILDIFGASSMSSSKDQFHSFLSMKASIKNNTLEKTCAVSEKSISRLFESEKLINI